MGKWNILKIKRFIRSNPRLRKPIDITYALLTGQYIQKRSSFRKPNYYIIRPPYAANGLFGIYLYALGHMEYAYKKNYIPIIDLKNYKTVYSKNTEGGGKTNVWEWFFKQPGNVSLEEALSGSYIISRSKPRGNNLPIELMNGNRKIYQQYCKLSQKIHLNQNTIQYIKRCYKSLFTNRGQVLGVFCRGTDYTLLKPCGHPVQPDKSFLIELVKKYMCQWECDSIFLTTEEQESIDLFQTVFPEKVIIVNQELVQGYSIKEGLLIEDWKKKEGYNPFSSALGYLTSIFLLSSCDYFIGAMTNGSAVALLLNNGKYKNKYIINLGLY